MGLIGEPVTQQVTENLANLIRRTSNKATPVTGAAGSLVSSYFKSSSFNEPFKSNLPDESSNKNSKFNSSKESRILIRF
jgi:hypothetical protein